MLFALALLFTAGLLAWRNPASFASHAYWVIAQRRAGAVIAMVVVALCQGVATVAFQTVMNNRIVTSSIMGFESLYVVINTATIYFFGASGLLGTRTLGMFVFQLLVMVGLSLVLYSWLLADNRANLQAMLLIGIVIGGG